MWLAGKIYFLSDRDGLRTLYSYDPSSLVSPTSRR